MYPGTLHPAHPAQREPSAIHDPLSAVPTQTKPGHPFWIQLVTSGREYLYEAFSRLPSSLATLADDNVSNVMLTHRRLVAPLVQEGGFEEQADVLL